jgi:hypothetical protein
MHEYSLHQEITRAQCGNHPNVHQQKEDEQNPLHVHNAMTSATGRNEALTQVTSWVNLENGARGRTSDTKSHRVDVSINLKCLEQINPQRWKADLWLPGAWGRGFQLVANKRGASFKEMKIF